MTNIDVDNDNTFVPQIDTAGSHGTLNLATDGTWNYLASSAFDSLNIGDSVSDFFNVTATDGTTTTIEITINGGNDRPFFTSVASTVMDEIGTYSYTIVTGDIDDDQLSITAPTLPSWLSLIHNSSNSATLTGTPTGIDVGSHSVSLHVTDGAATTIQNFTINVAVSALAPASNNDDSAVIIEPFAEAPLPEPIADVIQMDDNPIAVLADEIDAAQKTSGQADNTDSGHVATSIDQTTAIAPAASITGNTKSIDMLSTTHVRDSSAFTVNTVLYKQLVAEHYSNFTVAENLEQLKAPRIAQPSDVNFDLNIEIETSAYNQLRKEIDESFNSEQEAEITQVQLVTITTASFSVGIVSYFLRAGALFASLMSSVPLWRGFDPIAIFPGTKTKQKKDQDKKGKEGGESKAETFFDGEEQ